MEPNALALHVLRLLAQYQMDGRRANLQRLVDELQVRRADVRGVVTALDGSGHLDAMRMTLTFSGFALGASLAGSDLPPLRRARPTPKLVAA